MHCYICHSHESSLLNPLVKPCKCETSRVHAECLQKWNLSKRCSAKYITRCEVCCSPYWGNRWVLFLTMILVWLIRVTKDIFCEYTADSVTSE